MIIVKDISSPFDQENSYQIDDKSDCLLTADVDYQIDFIDSDYEYDKTSSNRKNWDGCWKIKTLKNKS